MKRETINKIANFVLTVITAFVSTFLMQSCMNLWSLTRREFIMVTQKSQRSSFARLLPKGRKKSRKFPLRFLCAARAKGTFCDFCDFCVTKKSVLMSLCLNNCYYVIMSFLVNLS